MKKKLYADYEKELHPDWNNLFYCYANPLFPVFNHKPEM
jgi:hypothetical protein